MDNKITIIYYWYDHLVLRKTGEAKLVEKAFQEKDYETFMNFVNKYGSEYFPQEATIFSTETDEILGYLDMSKEEAFRMVNCSEFECG